MSQIAENNLWFQKKRPIVDSYLAAAKQIEDGVAGHGLLYRPGFLGQMITQVERKAKFDLSEINYQIVSEAITRELAQTGFDYDIAVKEAMISWELEKVLALTALEQDLADNKKLRDMDKEELDRLEITTNLRKLVIMTLKTAIDVDMEELRQEMTDVDRSTFHYEDALLNAKLLTAQKKLSVIPYIEIVLDKQQLIIDAETDNASRKQALLSEKELLNDKRVDLITAREAIADAIVTLIAARIALAARRGELVDAKELISAVELVNVGYLEQYIRTLTGLDDVRMDLVTAKIALIPYINDKSTALIAYAAEIDAWIIVKQAIALIKEEMATLAEERVDKKTDIMSSQVILNTLRLALKEAEINLRTARMLGESTLVTAKVSNATELLTARQTALTEKIGQDSERISNEIDVDRYRGQIAYNTMVEVNDADFEAERDRINREANAQIWKEGQMADIASDTEITSQLVHLLA